MAENIKTILLRMCDVDESLLRRLRALEDRLDILEAQHRKLPPCDCPDCKAALAPYTGHTVIHEPLGEDGD